MQARRPASSAADARHRRNALMAMMIGALIMQGIQPGPQIMREQPQLVWGVIASMWVGNLMLLVINLSLIGAWNSMLKIP